MQPTNAVTFVKISGFPLLRREGFTQYHLTEQGGFGFILFENQTKVRKIRSMAPVLQL